MIKTKTNFVFSIVTDYNTLTDSFATDWRATNYISSNSISYKTNKERKLLTEKII